MISYKIGCEDFLDVVPEMIFGMRWESEWYRKRSLECDKMKYDAFEFGIKGLGVTNLSEIDIYSMVDRMHTWSNEKTVVGWVM